MEIRSFCLVYVRVQSHAVLCKVYKQRGVFVLLFISFMVFADTSNMMSVTSPYAFLVSGRQMLFTMNLKDL